MACAARARCSATASGWSEAELQRLHASGAAIAHCPTSNFFLGSGAFDLSRALKSERPVRVGLGTDIGAGTSFSILATLGEAYKAAQLNRQPLSAGHAYYLATRGGAAPSISTTGSAASRPAWRPTSWCSTCAPRR